MKSTFFKQNLEFKGILNYVYQKTNKYYPNVTSGNPTNGDELIDLIINPSTAEIVADKADYNQYIQFDLGNQYKSIITQYQIQTIIDGSAPITWRIEASNSISEQFIQLANKTKYTDICPIYNEVKTQCSERTTTKFQCDETKGPFRYFRFYIDLNMYGYYHNDPNDNGIRIGGFELFGALFSITEPLKSVSNLNMLSLFDSLTYPFFLFQL